LLSITYRAAFGNYAASRGWLARADRLLQGPGPGPLQGWLSLTRGYDSDDPYLAEKHAVEALEFAQQSEDLDLELCALSQLGAALVDQGRVEEGLARLDEAMAGSLGGERSTLDTVVFTACHMLIACDHAAEFDRASQWCRVVDDFIRRYGCPYLYACCRTIYGRVLLATGRWAQAEEELLAAVRMSKTAVRVMHAEALARLAELRIHQGRIEEAKGLLSGLEDHPAGSVAMAAIHLAQGQRALAVATIRRRLHLVGDDRIQAVPLLELLVEALIEEGDLSGAGDAAARLGAIARRSGREALIARADHAQGNLALAAGDHEGALPFLEAAVDRFARLEMPLEASRARLHLARVLAHRSAEMAIAEARTALAAAEQLGAPRDADRAAAFLRSLGVAVRIGPKGFGALTKREQEVLALLGSGLSNPEIAERLFISRRTAEHHVSNILSKLELKTRGEAVAYTIRAEGGEPVRK
jgi:DNA-binding CsgD family transcriptional regulator